MDLGQDEVVQEGEVVVATAEELARFESLVKEHPQFPSFAKVMDDVLQDFGHPCYFCLVDELDEEDDFTEQDLADIIRELESIQDEGRTPSSEE
jgi:hypothetical protein